MLFLVRGVDLEARLATARKMRVLVRGAVLLDVQMATLGLDIACSSARRGAGSAIGRVWPGLAR